MTDTRKFWKDIWDKKGLSNSTDLLYLDGYDHLEVDFDSNLICKKIIDIMQIKKSETILEVACGAGFLSREFQKNYKYVGVDYSRFIIEKHKSLFPDHEVFTAPANNLPFEDMSFDNVFCFGLFQYLPDKKYADQVISEMKRVTKKSIFLGDLKDEKTRPEHFVYPSSELQEKGYEIFPCVYDHKDVARFNALRRV